MNETQTATLRANYGELIRKLLILLIIYIVIPLKTKEVTKGAQIRPQGRRTLLPFELEAMGIKPQPNNPEPPTKIK